jgi:two-component system response regulator AtoC
MPKRKIAPESIGELAAGNRGSVEGLKRLNSQHPSVRHIIDVVEHLQARPYLTHAVISGEPGTGKEGLAHTLHELMHPEGDAPIVQVSTAGRDPDVIAGELFGRGQSSRGDRSLEGAVSAADGGTLLLDEVIGLSASLQRRLLELIRKGRYTRENEERERRAQLYIFVLTDGNLLAEVQAGRFRHDLYFKLARLNVTLPPIRERPEDIPAAAAWMANRVLTMRNRSPDVEVEPPPGDPALPDDAIVLTREAIEALRKHRWPGNFRELEAVVERALLLYSDGKQITANDVSRALV